MARVLSVADIRPSPRQDAEPWTRARVEEADEFTPTSWTEVSTIDLDPIDADPATPALRTVTVDGVNDLWARVVFLDAGGGEDNPSPTVSVAGPQFRPPVEGVAAVLRARTKDDSMNELGTFTEATRPTAEEVERLIIDAAGDVAVRVASSIPGEFVNEARLLVAMRVANLIEIGYLPEQTEGARTAYQSLRLTYEEAVATLAGTIQWWVLARRLEARQLEERSRCA